MRLGDTVKHGPSGETWIVAYADEKEVMPIGWPETIAQRSDCTLIKACDDVEHNHWAEQFRTKTDNSYRTSRVKEALGVG